MSAAVDRITFVGHATVLIELAGTRLLTDPVLGSRLLHIRRWSAAPAAEVTERLDAVLISHLHHDHLDFGSLRRLDRDLPVVVPRGGGRVLRRRGFANATELAPGASTGSARSRSPPPVPFTTAAGIRSGPRWRPSASTFAPGGTVSTSPATPISSTG